MHAHSDYKIEIYGADEEVANVAEVLANAFEKDEFFRFDKTDFIRDGVLNVEETYKVVFLEDITALALEMAKAAMGSTFTIEGVIDISESAGEYMNFLISYTEGELEEKSSCWYMYPDSDLEDMTYEEYCEDYGDDYSEDDFEKMKKGWFIVETKKGDILMETVPLDQVRSIEVKPDPENGDEDSFEDESESSMIQELQEATSALYEYAVNKGFASNADDQQALMDMIYFMTDKAAKGDSEAGFLLGRYILVTSNAREDVAFASQLLSEAAMQGYAPARDYLQEIGMSEDSIAPDEVDWDEMMQKAESGDAEAQYQVGLSFMPSDDGEDADFTKAFEWFRRAAENGHQMAADQLRLWGYADKLMNQGELARNASFMEVMQTIIGKAEGGDEEAQAALE